MDYGKLKDYVKGVMCKTLPAIDIPGASKSHQHEFQGIAALRHLLGDESRTGIPARFIFLDDNTDTIAQSGKLSWYDTRKKKANRRAEWRLYYTPNEPVKYAQIGDTLTVALLNDDSIAAIITRQDSSIDAQVKWLFGLEQEHIRQFYVGSNDMLTIDAAASSILDELGIEVKPSRDAENYLQAMLEKYKDGLPSTVEFSSYCRSTLGDIDYAHDDADMIVHKAYEREEMLFRLYERHEAKKGFSNLVDPLDVDAVIEYSKSLLQRRKSRAGKALEHSLETIFTARGLNYSRQAQTERGEKPDFLFPSIELYYDANYSDEGLTLLGCKTSCKDRWRQVLSEGDRVASKHLVTLQSPISVKQTDNMRAKRLQLVVPKPLHGAYNLDQQAWLWSVEDFCSFLAEREQKFYLPYINKAK